MNFYQTSIQKAAKRGGGQAGRPRRSVTKTYTQLTRLSNRMGNAVSVNLVNGITTFKKRIPVGQLLHAWQTGDYGKVMGTIPWDKLPDDLQGGLDTIGNTVWAAGNFQLNSLPPNINKNLRFDITNPHIKGFIRNRTGELVRRIQADAQKTIQDAVARTFTETLTPRQVASQIKSSIGLLPAHERALANYRQGLQAGGMNGAQVEKLSDKYEDKLLTFRTNMIAQTETRLATNQGQLTVWQEGVRQGYIDKGTAKKEWVVDGDPCETCEPMDGVRVGIDEPWQLEYPNGDTKFVYIPTEAHPFCMCGMELHFDDTEKGEDNEE